MNILIRKSLCSYHPGLSQVLPKVIITIASTFYQLVQIVMIKRVQEMGPRRFSKLMTLGICLGEST